MLELFLIGFLSIDGEERLDSCPRLLFTVALHVPPPTSSRRHTQQVARNQDFFSFFLSHPHLTYRLLSSLFTSRLVRLPLGLLFFLLCCFLWLMPIFYSARTLVQNLYWCLIKPTRISGSRPRDYVAYVVATFLRTYRRKNQAKGWFQTYTDHTASTYRANKTFNPAAVTLGKAA